MSPYIAPGIKQKKLAPHISAIERALININLSLSDVVRKDRRRQIVVIRNCICYYLYNYRKMTLIGIGKIFERDHSSILHSIRQVDRWKTIPKMYSDELKMFEKLFKIVA